MNGAKNGEATWVAIIVAPSGRRSISGLAISSYVSLAKGTRHRKIAITAIAERMSRERSSTRWETSVPSASCSASS